MASPTRRHRSFPASARNPADAVHTDQCIKDAARYGFCSHTMLRAAPRLRPWWMRHPRLFTLLPGVFFAIFCVCSYLIIADMSWLGVAACSGIGIAWLGIFMFGLPRFITADISKAIPPDAKERLGWDKDKPAA